MHERIDGVEEKVDVVGSKVDILGSRMDMLESKVDVLESKVSNMGTKLDGVNQQLLRHMQITDDQHHEIKGTHRRYEKWFEQFSRSTKVRLHPPIIAS